MVLFGWPLIKAIESEAQIVSKLEAVLVQAWTYLSDNPGLTYLSWTNMGISHTCPESHICPEQIESPRIFFCYSEFLFQESNVPRLSPNLQVYFLPSLHPSLLSTAVLPVTR